MDWYVHENVRCVECPVCGFTFAADHNDVNEKGLVTDTYTCPLCVSTNALLDQINGWKARAELYREMVRSLRRRLRAVKASS